MSYANDILTALVNRGDFLISDKFGVMEPLTMCRKKDLDELSYIPDENLKMVLDNLDRLINKGLRIKTVHSLLKAAAQAGYLKFTPYITYDTGIPTLVLKYNRFLHLFRGRYYQVSYSAKGIGCYQSAGYRLDYIRSMFWECADNKLTQYLYYINMISACEGIDAFDLLLKNNSSVLDEFMKVSTKGIFDTFSVTYDDLVNTLYVEKPADLGDPEHIYRIATSDTMDYCRVNIYSSQNHLSKYVGIEYYVGDFVRETMFTLPDITQYISEDDIMNTLGMSYDEYKEWVIGIYSCDKVFGSLVIFALYMLGVAVNFNVTYPFVKPFIPMKALNNVDVVCLNSLCDLE